MQQKVIEFESTIPAILDIEEESGPNTWRTMPNGLPYSLCTVLNHEIEKFNKLLKAMYQTLAELQKVCSGAGSRISSGPGAKSSQMFCAPTMHTSNVTFAPHPDRFMTPNCQTSAPWYP